MGMIVYRIPLDRIKVVLYYVLYVRRTEMIIIIDFLYLSYPTISIHVSSM